MERTPSILFMEATENLFGHKRENEAIIRQLCKIADVTVVFPDGWLQDLPEDVHVISYEPHTSCKNKKVALVIKSFKYMLFAKKLDRERRFSYIFFSACSIYTMIFSACWFKDIENRMYVLHHNLSDQLGYSFSKRWAFKIFKGKINHVLLESFIAKNLIEEHHVAADKIFCIPHPLNRSENHHEIKYDFVGISNSNDEKWISDVIALEKKEELFKRNGIKILLRSSMVEYTNGALTVFKGVIKDEEYYDLILSGKWILLPFPLSYKFRMSGTIVDAFSNGKIILGSNIPLLQYYEERFPYICKVGVDPKGLVSFYKNYRQEEGKESQDFQRFVSLHSEGMLKNALSDMLNKIPNETY